MRRLVRDYLKAALTGFAVGYSLALLLGRSVWLDMRVNIGNVIPACVACSLLISAAGKRSFRFRSFALAEIVALAILFSVYGVNMPVVGIVPASLFREAFHVGFLSLPFVNVLLSVVMVTANVIWLYYDVRGRSDCGKATPGPRV
jgi:hypothetical protein